MITLELTRETLMIGAGIALLMIGLVGLFVILLSNRRERHTEALIHEIMPTRSEMESALNVMRKNISDVMAEQSACVDDITDLSGLMDSILDQVNEFSDDISHQTEVLHAHMDMLDHHLPKMNREIDQLKHMLMVDDNAWTMETAVTVDAEFPEKKKGRKRKNG